jgi:hypothetical protein
MRIVMMSEVYRITRIVKPTKAEFFRNLKVGNLVRFSMEMKGPGRTGRSGVYASYIKIHNLSTGSYTSRSMNELDNRLENFELGEMQ